MVIRAWAATAASAPLAPFEYDPGPLPPEWLEIAVEHCGFCHSDLSMLDNEWARSTYPLVPGHEAVGRVVAVGDGAKRSRVGDRVGGHVPGAQNVPWATAAAEDSTFKPADELIAIYGEKGISQDKAAIAYCRIGERSAHTWFVLSELLGIPDVRNYDGSWTEWGSLIGAPIEK